MELRDSQSHRVVARAEEDAAKTVLNTALDHRSRGLDKESTLRLCTVLRHVGMSLGPTTY